MIEKLSILNYKISASAVETWNYVCHRAVAMVIVAFVVHDFTRIGARFAEAWKPVPGFPLW